MIPLIGFAPNADPTTPGVMSDCVHIVPDDAGFRGAPKALAAAMDALPTDCRGAVVANRLDGTRRIIAGTQTDLYELIGYSWGLRTPSPLAGSIESRWSFCQFGNTTLATNLTDPMQGSVGTDFDDVPTAPKAKIIVSASNNFVLAFHTNEGIYGPSPDRWWCCAQNNQNDWTPNVATSANTGRLVSVEGGIEAALPLGDYVVAYKRRGVYVGIYAGPPVVWQWNLVPGGECGAVGQDAVCDIGGAHFIVGDDNFWLFDGTRPVPIGTGVVSTWFLGNSSPQYRYRTKVSFDKLNNLVRVFYPSKNSSGECDACLVYHLSKKWGRDDQIIESTLGYISPGVAIDDLDNVASTIDSLPTIPMDSQYWQAGGYVASVFNTDHKLASLTGVCENSGFTTGDLGDDFEVTQIYQARIRFLRSPSLATGYGMVKFNEGDDLVEGSTCDINDGKFDLRQTGRFHRLRFEFQGDHRETAMAVTKKIVGGR